MDQKVEKPKTERGISRNSDYLSADERRTAGKGLREAVSKADYLNLSRSASGEWRSRPSAFSAAQPR